MLRVDIRKRLMPFELSVQFEHPDGVLILFGRSGAGKTTTLRCIAGIDTPNGGSISYHSDILFDAKQSINVRIQQRSIGFVFQTPTLFPHLTAIENIRYASGSVADADRWIELFHVGELAPRYPHELSGGEQQRVAIIRTLVTRPRVLLMDEPLSSIDIATRQTLLEELRELRHSLGCPIIYVTHSISEALRLGDRVIVLEAGRMIHDGVPIEVFHAPASLPLASLSGTENIIRGVVQAQHPDDDTTDLQVKGELLHTPLCNESVGQVAVVAVRPEDVLVAKHEIKDTSARNQLKGRVTSVEDGVAPDIIVETQGGMRLRARLTRHSIRALELTVGSTVYLLIKAWAFHPIEFNRTSHGADEIARRR